MDSDLIHLLDNISQTHDELKDIFFNTQDEKLKASIIKGLGNVNALTSLNLDIARIKQAVNEL